MNATTQSYLRVAQGSALAGFIIGGGIAAYDVLTSTFVREFQAGESSAFGERAMAIAQRAVIEGVGFGMVALVLGAFAFGLMRLYRKSETVSPAKRWVACALLCTAAFTGWVSTGTWVADDALPFLTPSGIFFVNLGGFAAILFAFLVFELLVRLLPWTSKDEPAAVTICAGLTVAVACQQAINIIKGVSEGYKSPTRVTMALGCFVVAIVATSLLSRWVKIPVSRIGARLAQGPLLPKPVRLVANGALVLCVLIVIPFFRMSAVSGEATYKELTARGTPDGPNVVFVTIDTLRADHLGCYGYERPTSPFLDKIAAEGTVFADASAPAAWTKPSTGTILTGLYPSRHGALYHGSTLKIPEGERTLAEAFQDAGYVTSGFVSNPNLKKVFEFDRGFDEYFDSPVEDTVTLASIRGSYFGGILMDLMRHQFNWKYENDVHQMNDHIFAWLRQNKDQRFFTYLHYIDPHIPYSPPKEYREEFEQDHGFPLFNKRKELVGIDLYDGEIRYTDDGIKALVDELKALDLWDNTLFVMTSDHGEEFFEHGVLGHGFSLYQPVIHVPLIARGPSVTPGKVVKDPVQIVDLAATVLDLAGVEVDKFGDGTSFAKALTDPNWEQPHHYFLENEFGQDDSNHRAFVLNGVRDGPWKLVLTEYNAFFPPQRHGREALYNLELDPTEQTNLIREEEHREVIERLIEKLLGHAQFLAETGYRDEEPTVMSPEIEASLKALGYL